MRSILITGATGNIGSYLVTHFRKNGYSVVPSTRKRNNVFSWNSDKIKAFYKKHNIGVVIHTAGVVDISTDEDIVFNAFSFKHLLVDTSVRYFLCGSVAEYGFQNKTCTERSVELPDTNYGLSKLMQKDCAEYSVKKGGFDIVYMRLSNVLLPYAHTSSLIETIMKEMPKGKRGNITVKNHHMMRDFIDIRDVCAFIEAAMKSKRHSTLYNVTSGSPTTYTTLISLFASLYNSSKESLPNITVPSKADEVMKGIYSNSRAKKDFGWSPRYTINDTITFIHTSLPHPTS